jgi:hypothetical protein
VKQSKISKQQQAREVFMRQMSERRGHALPAALPSEFDMLPGKSEGDVKLERRQKAQQLLEEVGRPRAQLPPLLLTALLQQMYLIEVRNRQLAKQREHEAAWSLEQAQQNLAIDAQEKREKELRLRKLKEQNKQQWLQQMKDKQNRVLSEKADTECGNIFGN